MLTTFTLWRLEPFEPAVLTNDIVRRRGDDEGNKHAGSDRYSGPDVRMCLVVEDFKIFEAVIED